MLIHLEVGLHWEEAFSLIPGRAFLTGLKLDLVGKICVQLLPLSWFLVSSSCCLWIMANRLCSSFIWISDCIGNEAKWIQPSLIVAMPSPQEVFLLFFHGLLYNCVTQLFHLNGLTNDFRGASAKFSGVLRVELQLLFLCTQVFRSVHLASVYRNWNFGWKKKSP